MIDALATSPLASGLGLALVHFVWQGTLIGIVTSWLLYAARGATAATRYTITCVSLLALTAAPIATTVASLDRAAVAARIGDASTVALVDVGGASASHRPTTGVVAFTPAGLPTVSPYVQLGPWLPSIVLLWGCGVLLLTVRLIRGWLTVERLRRGASRTVASSLGAAASRIAAELGMTRSVRTAESSAVDVPTVIGWIRPTILIPVGALAGLTPSQMDAILAHELAHIRRHDYLINGLQNVVETLLFYHPAVWWVSKQMRLEREHCCDDLAVVLSGSHVAYAGALASLEESRQKTLAFGVSATGGDLLTRVRRLLGQPTPDRHRPHTSMVWCVLMVVSLVLVRSESATPQRVLPARESLPSPTLEVVQLLPVPMASPALQPLPPSKPVALGVPAPPAEVVVPSQPAQLDEFLVREVENSLRLLSNNLTQTTESEIRALEETYRQAKVRGDVPTLERVVDAVFVETNQNGTTSGKAEALAAVQTKRPESLVFESLSIRIADGVAVVSGSLTEVRGAVTDRVLFTRVWKGSAGRWTLVSNSQFRDPRVGIMSRPISDQAEARPMSPLLHESLTVSPSARRSRGVIDPAALESVPQGLPPVVFADLTAPPTSTYETMPSATPTPGNQLTAPQRVTTVYPIYPTIAAAARLSGVVHVEAVIDVNGNVADAHVVQSAGILDRAAIDAVRQWKYAPARLNGLPVVVRLLITINFNAN